MNSRLITLVLAVFGLTSCGESQVETAIADINDVLISSHDINAVHYSLESTKGSPCDAVLHERWNQDNEEWHSRYRFQLHDIQPGTFLVARNGMRTIQHEASRTGADGNTVPFKTKKISSVIYRAVLADQDQVTVLDRMLTAMIECEERFSVD